MKRPAPYVDDSPNRFGTSQMQQMSAHRMQHNARMSNFPGRPDPLSAEQVQTHTSSRGEDPRQWNTSITHELNLVPSHLYAQGQGGNTAQSFPQGHIANQKGDSEKQLNNDPRVQSYEQDMEIGYDDKPSVISFEGLEHKFQEEILKLVKEQSDAEDVEYARHREKIIEINNQYQQRLLSLRAEQAKRREELLLKESQERLHQYQQSTIGNNSVDRVLTDHRFYQQSGTANHVTERIPSDPHTYHQAGMGDLPYERIPNDSHGYQQSEMGNRPTGRTPSDPRVYQQAGMGNHPSERNSTDPRSYGAAGAIYRAYGNGENGSYREHTQFPGGRSERTEARVPYPQGRVYNNARVRGHE